MRCIGTIEKVEGRRATVMVDRSRCGKCAGCVAMTTRDLDQDLELDMANRLDAGPGDRVVLEMPSGKVYKAYMKAFWLPVIALAAGYALGALAIAPLLDWSAQAVGVVVAMAAGGFFFWLGVRLTDRPGLEPEMLKLAGEGDDSPPS